LPFVLDVDQMTSDVKFPPFVLAILALGIAIPLPIQAGKSKKKSPPAAQDTSDRITALHLTSIIVTIFATHESKEYKVTPATRITVNGRASQLSGLATGMDVTVTPNADGFTAATIDARTRP
jgi:hypothetical protein